ncbi:putative disks large-like protein [Cricetulus griseus]|uniref:Putative disks large-like protein n=1 Tax=Cricetulus griseus TaxID=10029 RepID=A0A061I160_CRIGR|nr:putative disks large-like protein [Cricetulus griseus]
MFIYVVEYIDRFLYVEPSLNSWDEAYLIIVDDFSDVLLDSICQYFIEYFCINVHERYWSFLVVSLCGLGNKVIVAS